MSTFRKAQTSRAPILIGILMLLIVGGIMIFKTPSVNANAVENVKKLYELANPGTSFEVVSTTEQSGIYKVVLKSSGAGGTAYNDVFVTKDGKLLTPTVILVENSTEQLEKMKSFADCLSGKNVRIFGVLNQSFSPEGAAATTQQLQLFGVQAARLYASCDGQFLQSCVSAGISQVPSVVYNNTLYNGVKDIPWFEQATGCRF